MCEVQIQKKQEPNSSPTTEIYLQFIFLRIEKNTSTRTRTRKSFTLNLASWDADLFFIFKECNLFLLFLISAPLLQKKNMPRNGV